LNINILLLNLIFLYEIILGKFIQNFFGREKLSRTHTHVYTHNTYIMSVNLISPVSNFINIYDVHLYDKHPVEGGPPVFEIAILTYLTELRGSIVFSAAFVSDLTKSSLPYIVARYLWKMKV